jgi:hypothetical protein
LFPQVRFRAAIVAIADCVLFEQQLAAERRLLPTSARVPLSPLAESPQTKHPTVPLEKVVLEVTGATVSSWLPPPPSAEYSTISKAVSCKPDAV